MKSYHAQFHLFYWQIFTPCFHSCFTWFLSSIAQRFIYILLFILVVSLIWHPSRLYTVPEFHTYWSEELFIWRKRKRWLLHQVMISLRGLHIKHEFPAPVPFKGNLEAEETICSVGFLCLCSYLPLRLVGLNEVGETVGWSFSNALWM